MHMIGSGLSGEGEERDSQLEEQTLKGKPKANPPRPRLKQAGGRGGENPGRRRRRGWGPGGPARRRGAGSWSSPGSWAVEPHLLCGDPGPGRAGPFIEEAAVAAWQAAGGF